MRKDSTHSLTVKNQHVLLQRYRPLVGHHLHIVQSTSSEMNSHLGSMFACEPLTSLIKYESGASWPIGDPYLACSYCRVLSLPAVTSHSSCVPPPNRTKNKWHWLRTDSISSTSGLKYANMVIVARRSELLKRKGRRCDFGR
jgi:hypothetical protein